MVTEINLDGGEMDKEVVEIEGSLGHEILEFGPFFKI